MKKVREMISGKGLYKLAFCVCAVIMCFVTLMIAEYEESVSSGDVAFEGEELFEDSVAEVSENTEINEGNQENELNQNSEITSDSEAGNISSVADVSEDKTQNSSGMDKSFSPPVYGNVLKEFAINSLVYSKTMDDWRIHSGIDISADHGTQVLAAQDGKVTFAGYDISLGYVIIIQNDEFECVYASLSSELKVTTGDFVQKGSVIGYVYDSQIEEICDEPHLHFEIRLNGTTVNPAEYIYD